jgi:hypothetical protein
VWWSAVLAFVVVTAGYVIPQLNPPLPTWATVTAFSLIGLLAIWVLAMWVFAIGDGDHRDWVPKRIADPNLCTNCRYSFTGLPAIELCPECGARLSYAQVIERSRRAKQNKM